MSKIVKSAKLAAILVAALGTTAHGLRAAQPERGVLEREAVVTELSTSTGRILHHMFPGRLVAKKGKITLLRESLNTVAAAQALHPNGVADLPPPETEIFSVPPDYLS